MGESARKLVRIEDMFLDGGEMKLIIIYFHLILRWQEANCPQLMRQPRKFGFQLSSSP